MATLSVLKGVTVTHLGLADSHNGTDPIMMSVVLAVGTSGLNVVLVCKSKKISITATTLAARDDTGLPSSSLLERVASDTSSKVLLCSYDV